MDFASALERSSALRAKASAMELAAARTPGDPGIRLTLLSAKRMADRAEMELERAAASVQMDLCRYRLVRASEAEEYPVVHIAGSVISYQELFTAAFNTLKSGARASAKYARGTREKSLLNLAYTYPGSMGVLLTIPNNRGLFGEGELDEVASSIGLLTEIESRADVKAIAAKSGLNIVRKLFDWVDYHSRNGYSVDFQWKSSTGKLSGRFVTRQRFSHLASIIGEAEEIEPREIEIIGVLSTYSILSDRFAIVTSEDVIYSGKLSQDFRRREYKIPSEYKAQIKETTTTKYASEKVDVSYSLLSLTEIERVRL